MIRLQCPKCAWRFAVEDEMRGRQDRCPQCATPVAIAANPGEEAPAVPTIARWGIFLRTPLSEVDDRLRPEFERYLDALVTEVTRLRIYAPQGPGGDLIVPVTLDTGGKASFSALMQPEAILLDSPEFSQLFQALMSVRAPVTRGPAAEATIIFAIRGGSGRLQLTNG